MNKDGYFYCSVCAKVLDGLLARVETVSRSQRKQRDVHLSCAHKLENICDVKILYTFHYSDAEIKRRIESYAQKQKERARVYRLRKKSKIARNSLKFLKSH